MSSGIAGNAQSFNSYDSEATAVPLLTDEMGLKIAEFRVPHHMPYSGGASLASISVSNFHNTVSGIIDHTSAKKSSEGVRILIFFTNRSTRQLNRRHLGMEH